MYCNSVKKQYAIKLEHKEKVLDDGIHSTIFSTQMKRHKCVLNSFQPSMSGRKETDKPE